MPIKLPKGFQRRKSSINALEEVQNPPEPTFKVFERPGGGSKSFDGSNALTRMSQARIRTTPDIAYENDLFSDSKSVTGNRGSGATENSASTGPNYGSAASSARLSSISTVPSSASDGPGYSHQRAIADFPAPPTPQSRSGFSLRKGGRAFSFASKNTAPASTESSPRPTTAHYQSSTPTHHGRARATTASSASTATPPRLDNNDFDFGDAGLDGFGNMFDSIGKNKSREVSPMRNSSPLDARSTQNGNRMDGLLPQIRHVPSPITVNRAQAVESSPYSWASHDSKDILMGSPSPHAPSNPPPPVPRKNPPSQNNLLVQQRDNLQRRSVGAPLAKSPSPVEDEGAGLLRQASPPNPNDNRSFDLRDDASGNEELLFKTAKRPEQRNSRLTYGIRGAGQPNGDLFDPSLAASAQLAAQFERREPVLSKPVNKVMTPAQFERYRQQQELSRRKSDVSLESKSDDDDDYDDDEAERDRQAVKQRKKQEAHLSVYRQTMMKVTGEQNTVPPISGFGNGTRLTSLSTPDLTRLTVNSRISSTSGKSSGDEEDEDVPLGILAAHGFPNKNRPPARLTTSASGSNLRSMSQPSIAPAASVSGESSRGGGQRNLPVFARNLPQDPYYGAGLVNPSNRESFAMRGPASVHGAPPAGPVHPSGLVGVIHSEEQARAMRRGSPNATGNYENPGLPRSQTMPGMLPTMGYPGGPMPQMLTPGDQAQIHTAQQMQQMMHIQMQWMQQMQQHMMGMAPGQPMPNMGMPGMPPSGAPGQQGSQFLAPPGYGPQRPMSMPTPSSPRQDHRTMSTLTPGMSPWNNRPPSFAPGAGYAPSIAPSERSNVGMASRYRPVSIAPDNRTSSLLNGSAMSWSGVNGNAPSSTIRTVGGAGIVPGRKPVPAPVDDEDDDQGWAEMKKKRDKKKSTWKMKKTAKDKDSLGDYFGVAE